MNPSRNESECTPLTENHSEPKLSHLVQLKEHARLWGIVPVACRRAARPKLVQIDDADLSFPGFLPAVAINPVSAESGFVIRCKNHPWSPETQQPWSAHVLKIRGAGWSTCSRWWRWWRCTIWESPPRCCWRWDGIPFRGWCQSGSCQAATWAPSRWGRPGGPACR